MAAAPDPRRAAAEALVRVRSEGGYSNLVIDAALTAAALSGRDAAFAAALFYLSVERLATLEHALGALCPHKLSKKVAAVLLTGMAQLLYMPQVPPSAAVNETVRVARAMGLGRSAGLVNAVLRAFIRAGCKVPPARGGGAERLAVDLACCVPLARALTDWLGAPRAEAVLKAALGRPPVFLRVNTLKTDEESLLRALRAEGVDAVPSALPNAPAVRGGNPAATDAYRAGLFHVQDVSSGRAAERLAPEPGERVLDVCAAPGGKSFTMAQRMGDRGEVVSADLHPHRVGLIRTGAERLGLRAVAAVAQDGTVYNPELGLFDRVLCDAPCSGYGAMRRKPELKLRDPAVFAALPALQLSLLETSARYVRPGGRLVYATCTLNPAENGAVAGRFLAEHPDFIPLGGEACYAQTVLPDDPEGGDGFFTAALVRREGAAR